MKYQFQEPPKNFNCSDYRWLNSSTKDFDDVECRVHYIIYGKTNNLKYSIADEVPKDFDPKGYREYNPDIANQPDDWLKFHYAVWGRHENRVYHIDLPEDFDVDVYRGVNEDIATQTDGWLKVHYVQHGIREGRVCKDPWFDKEFFIKENNIRDYKGYASYLEDIRLLKSAEAKSFVEALPQLEDTILLVSHDNSIYGATHYLYLLFVYLRSIGIKSKIVETAKNPLLDKKYGLAEDDVIIYHNDPTLLYWTCIKTKPKKILFNSMNGTMARILRYLDRESFLIHSHEVKQHYVADVFPDYVVSSRIAEQYENPPKIQPPILPIETLRKIDAEFQKPCEVINKYGDSVGSRTTIGMCGSLTDRKNYKLFIELAKHFPFFDFLWVGGNHQLDVSFRNFYHVPDVELPYKYYRLMDYFLLTATEDPCPYVVLENLYLNNKVLTFKENIYTDHKHELTKDLYFEYPGAVCLDSAVEHIKKQAKGKIVRNLESGKEYILKKYSTFGEKILQHLCS